MENYLFIKEPSKNCKNVLNIVFINKKAFIKKVNDHIEIFKEKLGNDFVAENFLEKIKKTQNFVTLIKNDEMLWGILLGYGKHNSSLYDQRNKLSKLINTEDLSVIPKKKPDLDKLSSLEKKYASLDSKLNCFGDYEYAPLIVHSLNFSADLDHPETKFLEKKYDFLRRKISVIYAKGDFLEITLSKLTSE